MMIELGYMAKLIVTCPEWLEVESVEDVFAVSNCISGDYGLFRFLKGR